MNRSPTLYSPRSTSYDGEERRGQLLEYLLAVLAALLLAGCETMKNPPAQENTIRHFDKCVGEVRPVRTYLTKVSSHGPYN